MDLDDHVSRSDEGMLVGLSTLSGPGFGSPASESSITMRIIDTPSSSPLSLESLHQVNVPGYSHASDDLPSKLLSDHVSGSQEPRAIYKQTLGPDVYTGVSSSTPQPAEDYNIPEPSRCTVSSSIGPSVCTPTDGFDAVTRQTTGHMPNCVSSGHQLPDVGYSPTDNESSIRTASNAHSGLLADGYLTATTKPLELDISQSKGQDLQRDPALLSLPELSAHWQLILHHTITDNRFRELSLLLPGSQNTPDDCLQSTVTPHLPEKQDALSRSLLLESSHASYNAYNNNTAGSGSELVTDQVLTSHVEHFTYSSHENAPIDFASNHSRVSFSSQIVDHTEEDSELHSSRASNQDLETQGMGVQEDFNSSPPLSPSMSSAYMPSSSPIRSSSPLGPSFQTPPSSPPSPLIKDTQLDTRRSNNELLIPGVHRKFKSLATAGRYSTTPLSGFADQHSQTMMSPDVSALPSHQAPTLSRLNHCNESSRVTAAENSSNPSTTRVLSDGKIGLSKESDVEQKRLDSNVDAHRLQSTNAIPYPKRPTIAAHLLQQKKLAQPFRSPVLPQAPKMEPKPKASATILRADTVPPRSLTTKEGRTSKTSQEHVPSSSPRTVDSKIKYRTTRAATQFKSPLSTSNILNDSSLVRLTPTIQALERKLQILKRAVKVREDLQEEVLEGLVKKWSEAGREVAWEVWNLVKDNASSDGGCGDSYSSKKRAFEGSWGWENSDDAKKQRSETERNWGWDVVPISSRDGEEDELDAPKPTLGTMLMQLGVAADTLGWNEEEGSFIEK